MLSMFKFFNTHERLTRLEWIKHSLQNYWKISKECFLDIDGSSS